MSHVPLKVRVIRRETPKAFQLVLQGAAPFLWVPKSLVKDAGQFKAGDRDVTVLVSEWLLKEKMAVVESLTPE